MSIVPGPSKKVETDSPREMGIFSRFGPFGIGIAKWKLMNVGLYQSVGGMKAYWEQQHMLSENLSRANVAGNKQRVAAFVAAVNGAETTPTPGPAKVGDPKSTNVLYSPTVQTTTQVDFSQGPLEETGDPMHLGIEGDGFFTVREKSGAISYTRNGSFRWNTDGRITTQDGAEILGESNKPISVPTTKGVEINESGVVTLDGQQVGKITLTHFAKPATDLKEAVNGRFLKNEGVKEAASPGAASIRSGYLEGSNASPINQMVNMISVMRSYEANQKMITTVDDVASRLIKTAGS